MSGKRRGYRPQADYDPRRGSSRSRGSRWPRGDAAQRTASEQGGERDAARERTSQPRRADADAADQHRAAKSRAPKRASAEGRAAKSRAPQHIPARTVDAESVAHLSFADLGLGPNLVRVLGEQGMDRPFPIQAATIPPALDGDDVLGRARTGSGKTLAFGAAVVERLMRLAVSERADGARQPARGGSNSGDSRQSLRRGVRDRRAQGPGRAPRALILAPTRELALQIDRAVQPLARAVGMYTAQLVGGVPLQPQVHALSRGVDIVIGTPGRVQDLCNREQLDLRGVRITVVDEADHLCELGFLEPVQRILRETDRRGQRLLFSATLDSEVSVLVEEFVRADEIHEIADPADDVSAIDQRVYVVLREQKEAVIAEILRGSRRALVFCRTRAYVEQLADSLDAAGILATTLHGDLKQHVRERSLARFASGSTPVLIATDVAARGIHIDRVDLVLQADPPGEAKTYVHRVGRTGRAGQSGRAITLIPRTAQRRTREMLSELGIVPVYFGDFAVGAGEVLLARKPRIRGN